ncbi:hypothetical protein DFH08DRAFT_954252 [Mycena albidolilacea]|uniref:Uncharacterized protein n=1 Tax=Mycena albidolilacea TaxID=1033008 RepID=A0AAD7EX62_9AGAR|nr:hypothetical protein DFH08DRAFT_954252 [Mycena albidolilacea]
MRTQEQTVVTRDTKSRSYGDIPQKTQQSISCPRTLPQQETCVKREIDTAVELPPAAPSRPPPSNFIYTTFVSCVGWLLRILFCWRSSDVGGLTPSLRSNGAPAPQELEQLLLRRHSPAPSAPTHDPNPLPDWRLQMLMERRKKEADRAQDNRTIVVTFSGPARLNVELGVLENSRAGNRKQVCDLSEDEDGGQPPLPFVFSGPESVCDTTAAPVSEQDLAEERIED